jgi:hypothetical protein
MFRRLALLIALFAAACEDDPDDLNYLKAGSGGSNTAGTSGKAGASSDADAG